MICLLGRKSLVLSLIKHTENLSPQCQMRKYDLWSGTVFFSSCHWFLIFWNREIIYFISATEYLCDLAWGISPPPLNLISASEKIEDWILSSFRSLQSLIFWDSIILEIRTPLHQQHPNITTLSWPLLTKRKKEEERQAGGCRLMKSMPEIFGIQMILEITGRLCFLLCGYQLRCELGDTVCSLLNDM